MRNKIRQARRNARRMVRVTVALAKLTVRRAPRWALPLVALCAVIPLDPFDELLLLPVAVFVWIRYRAEFASVARSTWEAAR